MFIALSSLSTSLAGGSLSKQKMKVKTLQGLDLHFLLTLQPHQHGETAFEKSNRCLCNVHLLETHEKDIFGVFR